MFLKKLIEKNLINGKKIIRGNFAGKNDLKITQQMEEEIKSLINLTTSLPC